MDRTSQTAYQASNSLMRRHPDCAAAIRVTIRAVALAISIGAGVFGVASAASERKEKAPVRRRTTTQWVVVAGVSSGDAITQVHVSTLLWKNGIHNNMEGSIIYGISVPEPDRKTATSLLRRDSQLRGYYIRFPNEPEREPAESPRYVTVPVMMSWQLARNVPGTADGHLIRMFLSHPKLRPEAASHPFVASIRYVRRTYLALEPEGIRWREGYEGWVDLSDSATDTQEHSVSVTFLADGKRPA